MKLTDEEANLQEMMSGGLWKQGLEEQGCGRMAELERTL